MDNGIKYGQKVRIIIMDDEEMLILFIMDEGQGLLLEGEHTELKLSGAAGALLYIGHLYRRP
ncbi:hypothetical protein D3C78_1342110 [compost metagenome]